MSAGSICVRDVDLVDREETAWQAAVRMQQRGVGTLVVLNLAKAPVGIITDRDLVERVIAARKDPDQTYVGEIMTVAPTTVSENAGIQDALSLMRSGRFRRLPVVNDAGELVGMLSLDDILMLLGEEMNEVGSLLARETPSAIATTSP